VIEGPASDVDRAATPADAATVSGATEDVEIDRALAGTATVVPPRTAAPLTRTAPPAPPEAAAAALGRFENARRRMELVGEVGGVSVYDDFAHHPTAIRATVGGLRQRVGLARVLAVFEPRSNTMKLGTMKAQLPWALEDADLSFCLQGNYGWDAREALAPMGAQAMVSDKVDVLAAAVVARLLEAGWIANAPRPSVVRVAPPLIVSEAEIDRFVAAFAVALDAASAAGQEPA